VTQPQNPMDGYQGCTCQEIGRSAPQEQFFEAAFRDVITHHTTRLQCCSATWLQGFHRRGQIPAPQYCEKSPQAGRVIGRSLFVRVSVVWRTDLEVPPYGRD
jgi:hypothetical protein